MMLLAESLADEWLNRQVFFTMRGVKEGVGEIDILAVRPNQEGHFTGWHVEVQIGFRPVGYISKGTKQWTPARADPENQPPVADHSA